MNKMNINNEHFKFGERQSGVTTELVKEAMRQNGILVVSTTIQRDYFRKKFESYHIKILSLGDVKLGALQGINPNTPLIIDNATLVLKILFGREVVCIGDTYMKWK